MNMILHNGKSTYLTLSFIVRKDFLADAAPYVISSQEAFPYPLGKPIFQFMKDTSFCKNPSCSFCRMDIPKFMIFQQEFLENLLGNGIG